MGERAPVDMRSGLPSPLPSPLLDALGHALLEIDADGLVASWNTAAESMFGRRREDVMGLPLADLGVLSPELQDWSAMQAELACGQAVHREAKGLRSDGPTFPAHACGETRSPY